MQVDGVDAPVAVRIESREIDAGCLEVVERLLVQLPDVRRVEIALVLGRVVERFAGDGKRAVRRAEVVVVQVLVGKAAGARQRGLADGARAYERLKRFQRISFREGAVGERHAQRHHVCVADSGHAAVVAGNRVRGDAVLRLLARESLLDEAGGGLVVAEAFLEGFSFVQRAVCGIGGTLLDGGDAGRVRRVLRMGRRGRERTCEGCCQKRGQPKRGPTRGL